MPDQHANFASSLVATAPSPASSGTSLVVTAGHGTRFPTPPFNAVICPQDADPTPANAEIVRVTGKSTDTLTIARAQESTSARTVVVGDRIFAGATAKTLTDAELLDPNANGQPGILAPSTPYVDSVSQALPTANRVYLARFVPMEDRTITSIRFACNATGTANIDVGIYDASFNLLVSKGSTAGQVSTTGPKPQTVASTALTKGTIYYGAFESDAASGQPMTVGITELYRFWGDDNAHYELLVKDTTFPLPASLTGLSPVTTGFLLGLS